MAYLILPIYIGTNTSRRVSVGVRPLNWKADNFLIPPRVAKEVFAVNRYPFPGYTRFWPVPILNSVFPGDTVKTYTPVNKKGVFTSTGGGGGGPSIPTYGQIFPSGR